MRNAKRKKKGGSSASSSLFKPHEIDQWDDQQVEDEQAAMLKHLSQLMMGAVSAVDQEKNSADFSKSSPSLPKGKSASLMSESMTGLTHKRANTMKALLDVTGSPAKGH